MRSCRERERLRERDSIAVDDARACARVVSAMGLSMQSNRAGDQQCASQIFFLSNPSDRARALFYLRPRTTPPPPGGHTSQAPRSTTPASVLRTDRPLPACMATWQQQASSDPYFWASGHGDSTIISFINANQPPYPTDSSYCQVSSESMCIKVEMHADAG